MKRLFLCALILSTATLVNAQTTKTTKAADTKPASDTALKTLGDSANCAIGLSYVNYYKQEGAKYINTKLLEKGIEDIMKGNQPLCSESDVNAIMKRYTDYLKASKTSTKPVVVPKTYSPVMKTLIDSASYAMGMSMMTFYKNFGITSLNTAIIAKAFTDVFSGKTPRFDNNGLNTIMNSYLIKLQEEKAKENIDAGRAFLAENAKRAGVKTTASGLQYEVITEGTGIKPTAVDTFVCHYRGTFINGEKFDASYDRNQPLVLPVTSVIRGWTEGLQLMPVGSKYKFYIPFELGYGAMGYGTIPGGAALIFEVELLDVKKKL